MQEPKLTISPPENLLPEPDNDTKKGLSDDYTGSKPASNRVLYINLRFFKYGTNDKAHAAAIMFSLLLFVVIVIVVFLGMFVHNAEMWSEKVFNWLGSAFLFVVGYALGGREDNNKKSGYTENS